MPIFPTVVHPSARRRQPCLFILPFIGFLPPVLGNSQGYFPLPPWTVFLVPGTLSSMIPAQVSIYFLLSELFFPPSRPLHTGGDFSIYYTYQFYPVSVYQPSIDILSITEPIQGVKPRPIVSILILFTKLFFLFLVCTSDFSIGTRVAVLWLFFAVSLRYLACMFYFLQMAMYLLAVIVSLLPLLPVPLCIECRLQLSDSPLHHQAYTRTHLTTTSILLRPLPPYSFLLEQ
jgi:hypothetical protein